MNVKNNETNNSRTFIIKECLIIRMHTISNINNKLKVTEILAILI